MIISQSYASDKISTLTRSLAKTLEAEIANIKYWRELVADGEAFIASHEERFICIKVANGIEVSTWRYMWGRRIEDVSYRIDLPTEDFELDCVLWIIWGLYEMLLRKPHESFFNGMFNSQKEVVNG